MKINKIRNSIDKLDNKIVGLLNVRAKQILEIGKLKNKQKTSIYVPAREKEVFLKISRSNKGPLDNDALKAIYREVMSASLALEKPVVIAYMGPRATFSHLASLKKFGASVDYLACNSIGDVFSEVEKDNADYGVVPIENSIEGAISHTLDMLVDSDLKICSQITLDVSHNLLAHSQKEEIKRIYSNPQVFGQCRIWLESNLPKADLIEVSSTTRAAQIASAEKNSACIASILAAKEYRLKVLARDIEDSPHNITRFLVIGKSVAQPTRYDKTSIVFSIKDRVGALHDMLVPFKKHKINLTKIESRPSKRKAWDYFFFVDLIGHAQDKNVKGALSELEEKCKFLKVLGSYPLSE
ncbi:MAG TPA: prephenate dehydratase [Candidatus Omnitrophica bacterium]|nr:prephenate dehydratase [Candidatus Omnitrophota bacterium]